MSDLIDRQALLRQIDIDSDGEPGYYGDTWKFIDTIKNLPSAIDKNAGTELSTNLAEVGTDCISRQQAIDAIQAHKHNVLDAREYDEGVACGYAAAHNHICDVIAILPSAQPKRKTGHWINGYKRQTCSICKQRGYRSWNFCPNCGAGMRGEQDG